MMRYVELVKRVDGRKLIIAGHFTNEEIYYLRREGYRAVVKEKIDVKAA